MTHQSAAPKSAAAHEAMALLAMICAGCTIKGRLP
jgi:hypothetical protein